MSTPILPFAVWLSGTNQNSVPANDNSLRHEILNGLVLGTANDAAGGDSDGDIWIVGDTPSGAFATFDENDIAIYKSAGIWYAFAPVAGILLNVNGTLKTWDGSAYVDAASGGGAGGASVGVQYLSDTASTSDSDPGSGSLRWNNATQGSSTELYLDDVTVDGASLTGFWSALDSGGFVYLQDATDQDTWQIWEISSVSDESGYVKLGVSLLAQGDHFGDDAAMLVTLQQGPGAGGGMTNPMTTAGDIIVGGTSGAPGRLGVGTDGQVLTLVSGAPAWAAGGGGGLTNWTEAVNTSTPNGTTPVVSFTATNVSTHVDAALVAKGTGATTAQVADNTTTGGNKRGPGATDWQKVRTTANQVASGSTSTISGGSGNRASSDNSTIGGGFSNQATGSSSTVAGGNTNSATNSYAYVGGGQNNSSTAAWASISGGLDNTADGIISWCPGGNGANARGLRGVGVRASGSFGVIGDAQSMCVVYRRTTSDATPVVLTADNSSASATNQMALPNTSTYIVKGTVVARQNTTGDCKAWEFSTLIKRGANAASTSVVAGATPTVVGEDSGATAWTIGLSADTTNGALSITATGEASKSIKWVCDIYSCAQVAG